MRIAYFSDSHFPSKAANSVHVVKMCNALASLGHEVTLICSANDVTPEEIFAAYGVEHPFEIRPLRPRSGKLAKCWFVVRAVNAVRRSSFDLVYGRDLPALGAISFGRRPVIYETHLPADGPVRTLVEYALLTRRSCIGYVVISEVLKGMYRAKYRRLRHHVVVAHDAADDPGTTMAEGSISRDRLAVGYVGHLYKGRGIDVIMECAGKLPDMDFHIVGGEEVDVEHWRRNIRSSNVIFHGYQPNSRLHGYYDMFDVVLAPYERAVSTAGGRNTASWMSPLKIFEYMSHGKAMICSDLPVLREVLEHERTALLVAPDQPSEWVDALLRLRDDDLRRTIAHNARNEFLERYTWRKRAENILDTLDVRAADYPAKAHPSSAL